MQANEFIEAVQSGSIEAVRGALSADRSLAATRDQHGVSAIMHGLYRGQKEAVQAIRGVHPELDGFEAASLGDVERLRELLHSDPGLVNARSADGFTALHFACFFGQEEAVRVLLAAGADVAAVSNNAMQVMPLHSAAATRNVAAVRALLDHGAPVNAKQQKGWAPLHAAAQNGDTEMYRLLVSRGADPEQANDDGVTPAQLATKTGGGAQGAGGGS
jgi:uncharacterized protein